MSNAKLIWLTRFSLRSLATCLPSAVPVSMSPSTLSPCSSSMALVVRPRFLNGSSVSWFQ
nr:MAG TPA: hypothetical protein [Caudoviricetes sp.]